MRATILILLIAASAAAPLRAQSGLGTLDPTPPSGKTPDEIIKQMGVNESAFARARENYTFRQSVTMQTIDDNNNKPDGQYQQVTDVGFNKDGSRNENVVFSPQNTLERVILDQDDFEDLRLRIPLVLTTEDLPSYDVKYLGKQKVDELDAYVFSAAPRVLEKNKRYFEGKVWVDQKDLQIVMINGKNTPDKKGHFSFPFTTYYEQIDTVNWFPTYTRAEGTVHFLATKDQAANDTHMRNTVRYTDYKRFRSSARIIYDGQDITDQAEPDAKKPPAQQPPKK